MTQSEDGNTLVHEVNMNHKYVDIVIKALSTKSLVNEKDEKDEDDSDDSRSKGDEEKEMEIYLYDLLSPSIIESEKEYKELQELYSTSHDLLCKFLDLDQFTISDFYGFTFEKKSYYMNDSIRRNMINNYGVIWLCSYN
jgi:hypothetical protein